MLLTPPDEGPRVKGERLKLQDIVNGDYSPAKRNGEWVSAHEFLYLNQWNEISLLNLLNLSENVVMSNTTYVSKEPQNIIKLSVGHQLNSKYYPLENNGSPSLLHIR